MTKGECSRGQKALNALDRIADAASVLRDLVKQDEKEKPAKPSINFAAQRLYSELFDGGQSSSGQIILMPRHQATPYLEEALRNEARRCAIAISEAGYAPQCKEPINQRLNESHRS